MNDDIYIRKLIIENVRCFAGREEFNIRPLTFLVGENSTGKSTVLGCFQALLNFLCASGISRGLDFNVEPYQMGAFADIVRRSDPKNGTFKLGFELQRGKGKDIVEYLLTLKEREQGSEPIIEAQRVKGVNQTKQEFVLTAIGEEDGSPEDGLNSHREIETISPEEGSDNKRFSIRLRENSLNIDLFTYLRFYLYRREEEENNLSASEREILDYFSAFGDALRRYGHFSYSFAPIRSNPQRTYDPLRESDSPVGNDVPMFLMNISTKDNTSWQDLKKGLVEFGQASGLFTDIHVRRFGKSMGDPFQLQFEVNGPKVNIVDVGFGVNQILPILARILHSREESIFLMQQPEVHLHPKAQAELSSLLINLVKERKHHFLVESHSDAMINRTRIEIMQRKIAPEDVSLIYLETAGNSIEVHNIGFDKEGNLLNAPDGYRDFFLRETNNLLGFTQE